jgi:hypothetical protein
MTGLETVIRQLVGALLSGELWVDGSFLTEKIDPADVDLVLRIQTQADDDWNADQRRILEWFVHTDRKAELLCDGYILLAFPDNHPLHERGEERRRYWLRQFGLSRSQQEKGIAVINLPIGVE